MKKQDHTQHKARGKSGSALIMTIVITVLLAVIGALFVLTARVHRTATSARSDSEEVKLAVESIIGHLSQTLTDDVPGRQDANGIWANYYDYPGGSDPWLACIEPEPNGTNEYRWRHVSDVYKRLGMRTTIGARVVNEYQPANEIGDSNSGFGNQWDADADGDGVSDSVWVRVPGVTTSKGKPVYAAIRVIDNSGMVNVNTAYKFDPNTHQYDNNYYWVNGRSQLQIDLEGLAVKGTLPYDTVGRTETDTDPLTLHVARCGGDAGLLPTSQQNWENYEQWIGRIVEPNPSRMGMAGTPFDISDELDLRNRYFLQTQGDTRLQKIWKNTVGGNKVTVPFNGTSSADPNNDRTEKGWGLRVLGLDAGVQAERRHLLTAVNLDRVIAADGYRMLMVNTPQVDAQGFYNRLINCINPGAYNRLQLQSDIAQITANLWDSRDTDSNVTTVYDSSGVRRYGYERPCIYVSELIRNFWAEPNDVANPTGARSNDPNKMHRSYAIEIYRQYDVNETFNNWRVQVYDGNSGAIKATIALDSNMFDVRGGYFYTRYFDDANTGLSPYNQKYDPDWLPNPADRIKAVPKTHVFYWGYPIAMDPCDRAGWYADFYLAGPFAANSTSPTKDDVASATTSSPWHHGHTDYSTDWWGMYDGRPLADGRYIWKIDVHVPDINETQTYFVHEFWVGSDPNSDVNSISVGTKILDANDIVRVERLVTSPAYTDPCDPNKNQAASTRWIVADSVRVPWWIAETNDVLLDPNKFTENGIPSAGLPKGRRSYQRDLRWGQLLRRTWDPNIRSDISPNNWNNYSPADSNTMWLWPRNGRFDNVGDIAMTPRRGAYFEPGDVNNSEGMAIGYWPANKYEGNILMDMLDPNMQRVFQYVSVCDPDYYLRFSGSYDTNSPETRVKGRININTAPWRVIKQLPWVSKRLRVQTNFDSDALARAIVAYRDKGDANSQLKSVSYSDVRAPGNKYGREYGMLGSTIGIAREEPGFASIGEVTNVFNGSSANNDFSIRYYATSAMNGMRFGLPELHTNLWGGGWDDEYVKRYLLFARISDLATVRSDLFTVYMLVRLGEDGPQRRMIAILDRSGVTPAGGTVRVVALHPVPDAR